MGKYVSVQFYDRVLYKCDNGFLPPFGFKHFSSRDEHFN